MKVHKDKTVANTRLRVLCVLIFVLICAIFCVSQLFHIYSHHGRPKNILSIKDASVELLTPGQRPAQVRDVNCTFWDCFDIYACGNHPVHEHKIGVYVYPIQNYVNVLHGDHRPAFQLTREYYAMLEAITKSDYYTPNPRDACIFVPSIDMLNQAMLDDDELKLAGQALNALPLWKNAGQNHLVFNYVPGTAPNFNRVLDVPVHKSIIAGAGFDTWTYRPGFDVSLPLFSPQQHLCKRRGDEERRDYFLLSPQLNIYDNHRFVLQNLAYKHRDVLVLQRCRDSVVIPPADVEDGPADNDPVARTHPKTRGHPGRAEVREKDPGVVIQIRLID